MGVAPAEAPVKSEEEASLGVRIAALQVPRSAPVQATSERVWRELTSFERLGSDTGAELRGYDAGWDTRHLEALKAIVEA